MTAVRVETVKVRLGTNFDSLGSDDSYQRVELHEVDGDDSDSLDSDGSHHQTLPFSFGSGSPVEGKQTGHASIVNTVNHKSADQQHPNRAVITAVIYST